MTILKFDPNSKNDVLAGIKYATWRLSGYDQLHVGDDIELVDNRSDTTFANATATQIIEKPFRLLNNDDKEGHELYESAEQMSEAFSNYYPDRIINEDTIVRVIKFKLSGEKSDEAKKAKPIKIREVKLFTDGGSRGNPGPSSSGYAILDMNGEVIEEGGEYLGVTTNNQAEYQAVKLGLESSQKLGARKVHGHMDSLLVVNQMNGIFKIKNRELWPIHQAIKDLIVGFESVTFAHVPREMNKLADAQVNVILDAEEAKNI